MPAFTRRADGIDVGVRRVLVDPAGPPFGAHAQAPLAAT
jgi:hypothetical protein